MNQVYLGFTVLLEQTVIGSTNISNILKRFPGFKLDFDPNSSDVILDAWSVHNQYALNSNTPIPVIFVNLIGVWTQGNMKSRVCRSWVLTSTSSDSKYIIIFNF